MFSKKEAIKDFLKKIIYICYGVIIKKYGKKSKLTPRTHCVA